MLDRCVFFAVVWGLPLVGLGFSVAALAMLFRRKWAEAGIRVAIAVAFLVLGTPIPLMLVARRYRSRGSQCYRNLSLFGKAMRMYTIDHGERFPSTFLSFTNYVCNPKCYICPESGTTRGPMDEVDQWADYVLVTNLTTESQADLVHAYCKPGNHRDKGGTLVLFVDGSVRWIRECDFDTLPCDVLNLSRINDREPRLP